MHKIHAEAPVEVALIGLHQVEHASRFDTVETGIALGEFINRKFVDVVSGRIFVDVAVEVISKGSYDSGEQTTAAAETHVEAV